VKKFNAKPGLYIPTLYLIEGLPYTVVTQMSVVFFKNLNASNEFIGVATSVLSIPWTIKLFWAPLVDLYATRRTWIIVCQGLLAALIGVLAALVVIPNVVSNSLYVFAVIGFISATQDIAIDGYYMDVLDKKQQSFFVGVRNAAFKVAFLLGSGALVYLAGKIALMPQYGVTAGWCAAFAVCAVAVGMACLFHSAALPHAAATMVVHDGQTKRSGKEFLRVFTTFFSQDGIAAIVFYILTFRLGDAFMLKMAQPFLLDPTDKGGLGISTQDVGIVYGTVGPIFLLAGGMLGSWLVSKYGLKRCLWPSAIVQNSAILLYWLLSVWKPNLPWVAVVNAYEQFSYGLGTAAYTVYLLSTVRPEFKAAHYAIATALMAVGLLVPGAISGYLTHYGYPTFFLISFAASLPGIITIFFLPMKESTA